MWQARSLSPSWPRNSSCSPTQIHIWVNQVLAQAAGHLSGRRATAASRAKEARIEQLEAKLAQKNEVVAELMEANVR